MVTESTVRLLPETISLAMEAERYGMHGLLFQNVCLCPVRLWLHYSRVDCAHLNRHMQRGLVDQGAHYTGAAGISQGIGIAPDMLDFNHHVVSEIKVRKSFPHASRAQLLFYMVVLTVNTGVIWSGRLRYPSARRVETVELTEENQRWLGELFGRIRVVIAGASPPAKVKQRLCQDCSYRLLCWQRSTDDVDFN